MWILYTNNFDAIMFELSSVVSWKEILENAQTLLWWLKYMRNYGEYYFGTQVEVLHRMVHPTVEKLNEYKTSIHLNFELSR